MHCEAFLSTLEPWLDGELSAEAAAASAAHAEGCAHCAAALAARREERARLRALLDAAAPPDLREAILAASRGRRLARRRGVTWSALAAAAVLLLALGLRGLLRDARGSAQHGLPVLAYLDGAFEEPGAIRACTLVLRSGPRGLAAPLPSQPEGDAR